VTDRVSWVAAPWPRKGNCFNSKKVDQSKSLLLLFPSLPRVPSSLPPLPSPSSLPLLFIPHSSIFLALLLRVPSFPRKPQQCLPILAWIRTGPPGTSTVSMPKSWLWVIAVSLFFSSLFGNPPSLTNNQIVVVAASPPNKALARPASYKDTLKTSMTRRTLHPQPVHFSSPRRLPLMASRFVSSYGTLLVRSAFVVWSVPVPVNRNLRSLSAFTRSSRARVIYRHLCIIAAQTPHSCCTISPTKPHSKTFGDGSKVSPDRPGAPSPKKNIPSLLINSPFDGPQNSRRTVPQT